MSDNMTEEGCNTVMHMISTENNLNHFTNEVGKGEWPLELVLVSELLFRQI